MIKRLDTQFTFLSVNLFNENSSVPAIIGLDVLGVVSIKKANEVY